MEEPTVLIIRVERKLYLSKLSVFTLWLKLWCCLISQRKLENIDVNLYLFLEIYVFIFKSREDQADLCLWVNNVNIIAFKASQDILATLYGSSPHLWNKMCSSFLSVAVMNYSGQKQLRGGKDLFGLGFPVTVHHSRRSEQEFMQELETKTVREGLLLACWLSDKQALA